MKKPWSIVGAGLILFGLSSGTVYGQQQFGLGVLGGVMGPGAGRTLPAVLRGVNLTAEQKTRVQKIMVAHRPILRELLSQLRVVHKDMADKIFAPGEVRAEDLAPQVRRIVLLRSQLLQEGLNVMLEIRGVMTPEQLAKASEIRGRLEALRTELRGLFEESP